MNLPEDYQNKMQKMLGGDEYLQYLDSFNYSYGQTLRVNQLKKDVQLSSDGLDFLQAEVVEHVDNFLLHFIQFEIHSVFLSFPLGAVFPLAGEHRPSMYDKFILLTN